MDWKTHHFTAFLVAKAKSVAMESHKHFVTSNTKKSIYRYTLNQFWAKKY